MESTSLHIRNSQSRAEAGLAGDRARRLCGSISVACSLPRSLTMQRSFGSNNCTPCIRVPHIVTRPPFRNENCRSHNKDVGTLRRRSCYKSETRYTDNQPFICSHHSLFLRDRSSSIIAKIDHMHMRRRGGATNWRTGRTRTTECRDCHVQRRTSPPRYQFLRFAQVSSTRVHS